MPDPDHAAWAEELGRILDSMPRVRRKRMMGSYAIMAGARMFAFPHRHGAVLKLSPAEGDRVVRAGQGERFLHMGRRFGDWVWMPGRTPAERRRLLAALGRARDHVAATPPRTRPRARRR